MKLNYKRTIFVGFAFFLICSFWQAYDNTIPLILTNKFGMSQAWSGVIMALDNVLALFMLPLFGAISDKHHSKWGRRTPFIVVGTLVAAVMLIALSFVDNAQLKHLSDVSAIDDPAALEQIYDRQADETLLTPGGDKFVLSQRFTQEEFCQIRSQVEQNGSTVTNPDYTNYVVPARQACAWDATAKSPVTLVFFIVLLLIVLVSMAVFRSPAVALMPDVTLKPLRSKANAVINLMGSAGGILVLALGMVFATSAVRNSLMSYTGYFAVIAAIMLVALVIFMLTVREKEWAYEMQQQAVALGIEDVLLSAGQRTARQQAQPGERRRERTFFPAHTAFPHRHMMPPCTPRWPWVARCDQNSSAQHLVQMPLSMTFSGESPASVSSLTPMPCRSTWNLTPFSAINGCTRSPIRRSIASGTSASVSKHS